VYIIKLPNCVLYSRTINLNRCIALCLQANTTITITITTIIIITGITVAAAVADRRGAA